MRSQMKRLLEVKTETVREKLNVARVELSEIERKKGVKKDTVISAGFQKGYFVGQEEILCNLIEFLEEYYCDDEVVDTILTFLEE